MWLVPPRSLGFSLQLAVARFPFLHMGDGDMVVHLPHLAGVGAHDCLCLCGKHAQGLLVADKLGHLLAAAAAELTALLRPLLGLRDGDLPITGRLARIRRVGRINGVTVIIPNYQTFPHRRSARQRSQTAPPYTVDKRPVKRRGARAGGRGGPENQPAQALTGSCRHSDQRFKLNRSSASRYRRRQTVRFMSTSERDIVSTPAARSGKFPAAVASVISEPSPGAMSVVPR